jgi:eukaryotic-like serine/threonine-protein kinase
MKNQGGNSASPSFFAKNSFWPVFSPDGRWLAYGSNESGSLEIYVRPFPGPGGKWQVSIGGGLHPRWSHNRKELFYRTHDNKIMAVAYAASGDAFHSDKPRLWSPGQFAERYGNYSFDMHPDSRRAAVLKVNESAEAAPVNKVRFIFNFFDELRRKAPPQK